MDKTGIINMLKSELEGKLDQDTINRLNEAKSSKEALSILEEASIELSDDVLSAVAGGDLNMEENGWMPTPACEFHQPGEPPACVTRMREMY